MKKSRILFFTLCLMVVMLTSCSWSDWYTGMVEQQKNRCYGLHDSQQGACLEDIENNYDEYNQQRKDMLEK